MRNSKIAYHRNDGERDKEHDGEALTKNERQRETKY